MTRKQMKSLFTIHTNGQDEWIRVDKRTYEKAIDKFYDDHIAELKEKDKKIKTAKKIAQEAYTLGKKQAAEMDRFWAEFGLLGEDITINDAIAFFKAKDRCIAELEAKEAQFNQAKQELKAKDERIEAQSSVIIACQNAILQKDERITELEVERDKYNTIAAHLQASRQKAYERIEELETKVLIKGKPHRCDYKHSEVQNESKRGFRTTK